MTLDEFFEEVSKIEGWFKDGLTIRVRRADNYEACPIAALCYNVKDIDPNYAWNSTYAKGGAALGLNKDDINCIVNAADGEANECREKLLEATGLASNG